jgi:hypothetical protein
MEKVAEIWRFGLENELCLSSFYIRKYCFVLGELGSLQKSLFI